ncbi:hypothetical protein N182_37765 [Sinorhizobium sp. GL2]|nr:hypothetical protein N182_37765 [Sinorhizobium sp. GL2]
MILLTEVEDVPWKRAPRNGSRAVLQDVWKKGLYVLGMTSRAAVHQRMDQLVMIEPISSQWLPRPPLGIPRAVLSEISG